MEHHVYNNSIPLSIRLVMLRTGDGMIRSKTLSDPYRGICNIKTCGIFFNLIPKSWNDFSNSSWTVGDVDRIESGIINIWYKWELCPVDISRQGGNLNTFSNIVVMSSSGSKDKKLPIWNCYRIINYVSNNLYLMAGLNTLF